MRVLKSELFRSLSLGFALGCLMVAGLMGSGIFSGEPSLVSAATAAPHAGE
jgi:hypothetical protein